MIEIEEKDVIIGETYFIVCDDGVLRYLTAEENERFQDMTEFVFYDLYGEENYRAYSVHKIFKL